MSTPKDSLRSIVMFSTPLGPRGTASSSGSESAYPGNWLPSPTYAQHWGVLVQDEENPSGVRDTFFELYRPENTIDVLRRSRADREASETASPRSVYYEKTGFVTDWSDDEIEKCGKNICSQHMNGTYLLLEANCQTMANLLAQRIALGSDPIAPYQTLSHYLVGGTSRKHLFALSEFDQARPTKLKSILRSESRDPMRDSSEGVIMESSSGNNPGNAANGGTSDDELIDLDEGKRPDGPLHVSEVRSNARFWARDSTSLGPTFTEPPPFSLPEGYQEWAKSQRDCSNPERFPGPDSPSIKRIKDNVSNHLSGLVEYHRSIKGREEEIKLWHNPNIPEETRAKVMAQLTAEENDWLRKERVAKSALLVKPTINGQDSEDYQNPEDGWFTESN